MFVYIVSFTGLAYILGHSFITKGVRAWLWDLGPPPGPDNDPVGFWQWFVTLIECPACFGTWFGFCVGAAFPLYGYAWWQFAPVASLFTAGVGVIMGRLTGMLEIR